MTPGRLLVLSMSDPKPARMPLNIIIVGAGLAGLSAAVSCALAGHHVLVIESAKELAEVSGKYLSLYLTS